MTIEELGYNKALEQWRRENDLAHLEIGRVLAEHKERYVVETANGQFGAEITGNLRFTAESREHFPAVGDWVAMATYDEETALIHSILPRRTVLSRRAAGHRSEVQIIATNVDCAFLLQAVDRDFSINRLDRYLAICNAAAIRPVIVLTKTDLIDQQQLNDLAGKIKERAQHVPVVAISNVSQHGYTSLKKCMTKGQTHCMLGSSGVGKSSLLNNLIGKSTMRTDAISESTMKGRHTTTHRELFVLADGSILIDNPGMREVGIAGASGGLKTTFDLIFELAEQCRFKDCTHTVEDGCAVVKAIENEEVDPAAYDNYLKMQREQTHFDATLAERRRKDKKLAKILKDYKKQMKRNR